jgi:hypothetical protein
MKSHNSLNMATDYKNNFFNENFELLLNTRQEKNDFLNYLKEVIDGKNDFYAKVLEVIGLCAKVRLDGLDTVDETVENQSFYMDRFLNKDC